jgi:hypothetical protein
VQTGDGFLFPIDYQAHNIFPFDSAAPGCAEIVHARGQNPEFMLRAPLWQK